jgi:hypothetical protein
MKYFLRIILTTAFYIVATFSVTAQQAMMIIKDLKISCLKNTTAYYKGEVNTAGQPEGYGECMFADSSCYTGQFTAGRINGEGVLINKPLGVIFIAQWEDGQIKGQYFATVRNQLLLLENANGSSYTRRISYFDNTFLVAMHYSDTSAATTSLTQFRVNKYNRNGAAVVHSPSVNSSYGMEGVNVCVYPNGGGLWLNRTENGISTPILDKHGTKLSGISEKKLKQYISKPLPTWLNSFSFDWQQFYGFGLSYECVMKYETTEDGDGYLNLAKQQISNRNEFRHELINIKEHYRYIMGDISSSLFVHDNYSGNGVVMNCYSNKEPFNIAAGEIHDVQNNGIAKFLRSGFQIEYFDSTYYIIIGDWDDKNEYGKGYRINPYEATFFRGNLKNFNPSGTGELLLASGKTAKVNVINGEPKVQNYVPAFSGIKTPALFAKIFDIEIN